MLKQSFWTASLLFAALTACQGATFHGTTPNRAKLPNETPEGGKSLQCTAAPAHVAIGQTVTIAATATGTTENLKQVITGGDSALESELKHDGATGIYQLASGGSNALTADKIGSYRVELKLAAGGDVLGSCEFVVETTPTGDEGGGDEGGDESGGGDDGQVPVPPTPPCTDSQISIGAKIAFLIDNSNSNSATDCPSPKKTGTFNGADLYECQGQTNREAAVLAAHDLLSTIAANEPGNALAKSSVAISSFPTRSDYVSGFATEMTWTDALAPTRGAAQNAMAFSRKPFGLTPYGAALSSATGHFGNAANDERAKVAVLVTDGEPTDRKPHDVIAQAQALKASGVDVITVFVTAGESRAQRETKHVSMLKNIDNTLVSQGKGHWFDESRFANFDGYIATLLGRSNEPGVIKSISSAIVEVSNSSALKKAFLDIIKSKAIRCE